MPSEGSEPMDQPQDERSIRTGEPGEVDRFTAAASHLSEERLEEETIHSLMDAALRGGKAPVRPGPKRIPIPAPTSTPNPEALNTDIEGDWTTSPPPLAKIPAPAEPASPEVLATCRPEPLRTSHKSPRPNVAKRSPGAGRWVFFFILFLATAGAIGFRGYQIWALHGGSPEALLERASELHAQGRYLQALETYRALQQRPDLPPTLSPARLAFAVGGAYEQLWRNGSPRSDTDFELALESLDQAVSLDTTDLHVYAVDALLAKSALLIEKARETQGGERHHEQVAWECLAALIQNSDYRSNPAVRRGIPQRILAEGTAQVDPQTAISLLLDARQAQGDLEKGIENLRIALIYRDILSQPDQAEAFFQAAAENELASEETRKKASEALEDLRSTHLLEGKAFFGQPVTEYVTSLGKADWSQQP